MSKPVQITSAVTFYPSSYDSVNSFVAGIASDSGVTNGYTPATSTTRVSISANSVAYGETNIYFNFDCSSIPQDATITSVSCDAKAVISSNYFETRIIQLCAGTTKKGAPTTVTNSSINNTVNVQTISNTGTWTREELNNIKILIQGIRGSSTNAFNISFYGATLTINYSVDGTMYEINASSNTTLATIEPSSQDVFQGESGVVKIDVDNVGDIIVEDNGTDVTSQLVVKEKTTSGSSETVLGTYTLISGGFDGQGASYFQGLVGKGVNSTQTTNNYYSNGNGTIAVFTYDLVFSNIPSNATITRLYCQVNGHAESTSNNNEYMCAQLILGNTATTISDELNFKSVSTSNSTQTLEATTLPTVAQLSNLKLKCRLGYYGGAINGATCYIEYTVPVEGNLYYYEYTISNISADHEIVVSENVIVPPEEDSGKTYYPITISSINATTNPGKGTVRVESGTSQTITITPSDPQLTLALDNGVDVTSQLVAHGGKSPTSALTTVQGASYGFAYCGTTGYYMSQNKGVDKSAAVCKIDFDLPVRCLVTIEFINYAEATYDFGVFGNIDTPLSTNYYAAGSGGATITDSDYKLACNTSTYNTSTSHTITYEIESGEHSIYIKYSKDDATSSNNDTLQFRVTNIETLEPVVGYYTYDLNNINQSHSLIFIFGDVIYYFVTSNTSSNAKLYPNGQIVQLPGDTYRLVIVPENIGDTITVRDNNIDVTGSLVKKEETVQKEGSAVTVVNYIYTLSNIQTGHTIIVASEVSGALYVKTTTGWVEARRIWKKNSKDEWVEQTDLANIFATNKIYINRPRP